MAECKDCLHYELCKYNTYQEAKYFGKDMKIYITIDNNTACKFFKLATNVIEVIDNPIIYVQDKWLVLNMESEQLGKAIKTSIDYLTKGSVNDD